MSGFADPRGRSERIGPVESGGVFELRLLGLPCRSDRWRSCRQAPHPRGMTLSRQGPSAPQPETGLMTGLSKFAFGKLPLHLPPRSRGILKRQSKTRAPANGIIDQGRQAYYSLSSDAVMAQARARSSSVRGGTVAAPATGCPPAICYCRNCRGGPPWCRRYRAGRQAAFARSPEY